MYNHHLSKVHVQPSPVQSTCLSKGQQFCASTDSVCTAFACPKYMYSHRLSKVQHFCASTIRLYVQPLHVQSTAVLCINDQIVYIYSHRLSKVQQFCASTIRLYVQPSPVQSTPVLCINYQTVCTAITCPKYTSSVHQLSDCMYSHHLSKVYQFCASTIRLYVQPSPVQSTPVLCINYQTVCTAITCPKYTSSVHQLSDCMYSHHLSKVHQFCASTIRLYVQPSPVQSIPVLCINYQTVCTAITCPKYTSSVHNYQTIQLPTGTKEMTFNFPRGLVCKESAIYTIMYKTTSHRVNYFLKW